MSHAASNAAAKILTASGSKALPLRNGIIDTAITLVAASEILREDERHRQADPAAEALQLRAARHCAPKQKTLSVM
jgi:hypothetical protein